MRTADLRTCLILIYFLASEGGTAFASRCAGRIEREKNESVESSFSSVPQFAEPSDSSVHTSSVHLEFIMTI